MDMITNPVLFIASIERFSPRSFWDYKQYTWGYGTEAPGKDMTITEPAAKIELQARINTDTAYLKSRLTRTVTPNCMTALLSFSFNEGIGAVARLVTDINAGKTMQQVADHASLYIYAGGIVNRGLVDRRAKEAKLFLS